MFLKSAWVPLKLTPVFQFCTAVSLLMTCTLAAEAQNAKALPATDAETFYQSLMAQGQKVSPAADFAQWSQLDLSKIPSAKLILYIQQIEQVTFQPDLADQVTPRLALRMAVVGQEISKRLHERTGVGLVENRGQNPASIAIPEAEALKAYAETHATADICNVLRLQYAQTIIRMATLVPSRQDLSVSSLSEEQIQSSEYQADRERAAFEMRLFLQNKVVSMQMKGRTMPCRDLLFPEKRLLFEMTSRFYFSQSGIDFIYKGDDIRVGRRGQEMHITRWPLGRSLANGGRPTSTQFMDPTMQQDWERKDIELPGLQMQNLKTIDAFDQALRDFDQKFLLKNL